MQPKGRPGRGVWEAVPAWAASGACLTSVTKPWTAVRSQSGLKEAGFGSLDPGAEVANDVVCLSCVAIVLDQVRVCVWPD
jgi:hypothetical protein